MKKLIFCLLLVVITISASAKRVGVYCFFSDTKTNLYEDDCVKLTASCQNNTMRIQMFNKTRQVIFVDKANSFVYINGTPVSLFTNAVHTTGTTSTKGNSVNLGSIASAMGIGGALGVGLSGVNVGGSNSMQNTTTIFEQRVVAIAPQALEELYVVECELRDKLNTGVVNPGKEASAIMLKGGKDGYFINPQNRMQEKFRIGASRHYEQSESPLEIKSAVTYSTNEQFTDSQLAIISHYIGDIVIDNKKGIRKDIYLPYCAPYFAKNLECYKFKTGRNVGGLIGGITYWTFCSVGVVIMILGPAGALD